MVATWGRAAAAALAIAVCTALISVRTVTLGGAEGVLTLAVPGRANAHVSLVADRQLVAAAWAATAAGGGTDVFAATSRDAGRTFSAPVRVNSTPGDASVNGEQPPRIGLKPHPNSAPDVFVVWTAKGTQGTRLLSSTSSDLGRTFSTSALVPGTDAPGNRGWEAAGIGPGGRIFSAWLDHRKLARPQQQQVAGEHRHGESQQANATAADGVAMAQLSQLYVAPLDGSLAPQPVTGGVCYCCKTAMALGSNDTMYLAWRHVYPNNMRDIAFTASRDGGRTFAAPVRVSEDQWQIAGCPDDGPSMGVDAGGSVHVVWPSVVTERGGPVKAIFHSVSRDGRTFSARERIPSEGQAHHPQLGVSADGSLAIVWDESGSGTRRLAAAVGRSGGSDVMRFERLASAPEPGSYPVIARSDLGWLRAWTTGDPARSVVRVAPLPPSFR